ncbi:MAG: DUF945 domain-containing protein [Comamonadaceae bacterium]|nr:MAG: DUF945 domain-containing protein [Comamonadaceae bacterium]
MKKYLVAGVGVVAVLGASWVCASWYTGKRIEQAAVVSLADANAYLQSRFPTLKLNLRADHYHRGFFSSQARYVLESGLDEALATGGQVKPGDTEPLRVMLDVNIEHGPFPSTQVDRGQFAPAMAYVTTSVAQTEVLEPLFQLTGGQSPFLSSARVTYQGDAALDWSMPALTYKREGRSLKFSGMKGDGDFTREGRAFIGNLRVELIEVQGAADENNTSLSIEGLSAGLNTRRGTFDLGVGQSHVHAEHIELKVPDSDFTAQLDNAGYRVVIEEDGKVVNLELVFGTEALKVGAINMGAMRLVTKARSLDGSALQKVVRQYDALSAGMVTGTGEGNPEDAYMVATNVLMEGGKQILAGRPVFAIEPFLWKHDKGEQRAAISVQLGPIPQDGPLRERALKTVTRVDGFVNLSRPMAIDLASKFLVDSYKMQPDSARSMVSQQIDQAIEQVQDMGLARLEGDKVVSRVQYADGTIDLNGEKMPLDDFLAKFDEPIDEARGVPPELDDDEMSEAPDVADEAEKAVDGAVDDARTVLEAAAAGRGQYPVRTGYPDGGPHSSFDGSHLSGRYRRTR